MKDESVRFFLDSLKTRQKEILSIATTFLHSVAHSNDVAKNRKIAKDMIAKIDSLFLLLIENRRPVFVNTLKEILRLYSEGSYPNDFIVLFVELINNLKEYKWEIEAEHNDTLDLDAIYEKYKKESKIPELFNKILELLEEMRSSSEIDSVSMLEALNKIISTLRKSVNGSYFFLNGAWSFLINFFQTVIREELSKIPVFGSVIIALEKTIEEASGEMIKLQEDLKDEVNKRIEENLSKIPNRKPLTIAYNQNGVIDSSLDKGENSNILA